MVRICVLGLGQKGKLGGTLGDNIDEGGVIWDMVKPDKANAL
jgi:hypothetical protein